MTTSSKDNVPCLKAQVISNWFSGLGNLWDVQHECLNAVVISAFSESPGKVTVWNSLQYISHKLTLHTQVNISLVIYPISYSCWSNAEFWEKQAHGITPWISPWDTFTLGQIDS